MQTRTDRRSWLATTGRYTVGAVAAAAGTARALSRAARPAEAAGSARFGQGDAGPSARGVPVLSGRPQRASADGQPPIRIVLPGVPSTLDPQRAISPPDRILARLLFEPLLRYTDGPLPQPAAAERVQANEDGTRWTFTIRQGMRWADGGALTATHFVDGWLRVFSRDVPDELFMSYRPVYGSGIYRVELAGQDAVGLRARGNLTLEISTDSPAAHLPHVAALWLGAPYRSPDGAGGTSGVSGTGGAVGGGPGGFNGLVGRPGNGPFVLASADSGGGTLAGEVGTDRPGGAAGGPRVTGTDSTFALSLRPNERYWAQPPAAALTLLSRPRAVEDALSDLASWMQGGASSIGALLADIVPVPEGLAGEVLRDPRLRDLLLRQGRPATLWLDCNVTRAPLDDVRVRQALAYAIDRQQFVDGVLDGAGRPACSLLPSGVLGHDPELGSTYRLRPAVARELLAAARVSPEALATLVLLVPDTPLGRRAGAFLQGQLARSLGVHVRLTAVDRYGYARAREQRRFDLAFGGWEAPYPDPEGWFWLVFGDGKAENRTGWSSAALDTLWRQADEVTDPQRRLGLYAAAQQILLDEMPVIFLAQPERLAAVHPRVQGLLPAAMDEIPGAGTLARAWLQAP